MIDTHCHLYSVENPLEAARAPGLNALVVIGHTPEHARDALNLSRELEHVFVTVGLHPCDANLYNDTTKTDLEKLMLEPKVVGIGESGVDYYWDSAPKNMQLESLNWQLECARKLDKPIVIHTRDKDNSRLAFADCALELRNAGWSKGILHCFAGDPELLETGLALGFHISFAGNLTYKNAVLISNRSRTSSSRTLAGRDGCTLPCAPAFSRQAQHTRIRALYTRETG